MIKKAANFFYWFIITLLILVAGSTAFTVLEAPGGYRLFVVQSGSMEPSIKTGSVVLIAREAKYQQGDVITFLANPNSKLKDTNSTITHRIVSVQEIQDQKSIQTKGDANRSVDQEKIVEKQILGKVLLSIPFAGYAVTFTKTQLGFISLIVIPAILIIYNELMTIKNEAVRLISERKRRKLTSKEEIEEKIGEGVVKVEEKVKNILNK